MHRYIYREVSTLGTLSTESNIVLLFLLLQDMYFSHMHIVRFCALSTWVTWKHHWSYHWQVDRDIIDHTRNISIQQWIDWLHCMKILPGAQVTLATFLSHLAHWNTGTATGQYRSPFHTQHHPYCQKYFYVLCIEYSIHTIYNVIRVTEVYNTLHYIVNNVMCCSHIGTWIVWSEFKFQWNLHLLQLKKLNINYGYSIFLVGHHIWSIYAKKTVCSDLPKYC